MSTPPKVFVSYSHASQSHKDWVRKLASDLRKNGVDARLDQWDLLPGADAATFMEEAVTSSDRVVVVCSKDYVEKADAGKGGVGYEKTIITAELVEDLKSKKFIPILRNSDSHKTPKFLGYRIFIAFDNDVEYESSLGSLLREIHGAPADPKPPIGPSPFKKKRRTESKPTVKINEDKAIKKIQVESHTPAREQLQKNLKKLLMDNKLIGLHDLVVQKADSVRTGLTDQGLFNANIEFTKDTFLTRIAKYEEITGELADIFAIGCFWAKGEQERVFAQALEVLLEIPAPQGTYYEPWLQVARYPALRIFYSGGIAAVANESYSGFLSLATKSMGKVMPQDRKTVPAIHAMFSSAAFAQDYWKWLPERERHFFPVSDFLEDSLREPFQQLLATDDKYHAAFDHFEFLVSMTLGYLVTEESEGRFWAPLGTYVWRRPEIFKEIGSIIDRQKQQWPLIQEGMFGGSFENALKVLNQLQDFVLRVRKHKGIFG